MYDVIVVGAGPGGSYSAYLLAKKGFKVLVLEEHPQIGVPTNCAGLIGAEAFRRYDLPLETVRRAFNSATFFSPAATRARVASRETKAYVVSRRRFDQALADRALNAGASFLLDARVTDLQVTGDRVGISLREAQVPRRVEARAVVLATGVRYTLAESLGLERPGAFMEASHVEAEVAEMPEVEVYFGREVAPGNFAWAVPNGDGTARLGVCAGRGAAEYLRRLLATPLVADRLQRLTTPIKVKPIPITPVAQSYLARVLLVGDAAGQVKPTTGGGIYFAIIAAEKAAQTLEEAFARSDFSEQAFAGYERRWRRELGLELRIGQFFRRICSRLNDEQIDLLLRAHDDPEVARLLERQAEFERHKGFVLALCRSRVFYRAVWEGARSVLFSRS